MLERERAEGRRSTSSWPSRPSASIPGNPTFKTHNVPKVVGGITPACSKLAAALYGDRDRDGRVRSARTRVAEMVKLLENTFRAVNIGLVNEIALMCDRLGIDVWEVVRRGRDQAVRVHAVLSRARASAATASRSIPFYLSWKAKQSGFEARFIELAGHVNGAMPHFVVDKVAEALNTQRKAVNGVVGARSPASPTSATSTTSASRRRST